MSTWAALKAGRSQCRVSSVIRAILLGASSGPSEGFTLEIFRCGLHVDKPSISSRVQQGIRERRTGFV